MAFLDVGIGAFPATDTTYEVLHMPSLHLRVSLLVRGNRAAFLVMELPSASVSTQKHEAPAPVYFYLGRVEGVPIGKLAQAFPYAVGSLLHVRSPPSLFENQP